MMFQIQKTVFFVTILLLLAIDGNAQYGTTKKKQVSEIEIKHSYTIKYVKHVKAILFAYEGNALYGDKFINLSERLRMRFKKRFQLGFQYNMKDNDRYQFDRAYIPKNSNPDIKHDLMCKIRVEDMQFQQNKNTRRQMYRYRITLELFEPGGKSLVEFAELEVRSYKTAFDTNRALVKLIDKFITEK